MKMENKMPDLVKVEAEKTLSDIYQHKKFEKEEFLTQELSDLPQGKPWGFSSSTIPSYPL